MCGNQDASEIAHASGSLRDVSTRLTGIASYAAAIHKPLGKSASFGPSADECERLTTLNPIACLGVDGVRAFSYSEIR